MSTATTSQGNTHWNMLAHIAEQRMEECARRRAKLAARRDEAAAKLQTLVDYRAGYDAQLARNRREGIGADGLRNFQSFLASLERATAQQTDLVAAIAKLLRDTDAELTELRRKLHSYQVMQSREASTARVREGRRQQALTDEIAARRRGAG